MPIRRIFLPRTVAEMLVEWKEDTAALKTLLGDEYVDYGLVFAHENGRPVEGSRIRHWLQDIIDKGDLPQIVFHSIRHTSITYKLKLNGGDIKAVQGDSGHSQVKMVTDVYSHIMDEDRKKNAQNFEKAAGGDSSEVAELLKKVASDPKMLELVTCSHHLRIALRWGLPAQQSRRTEYQQAIPACPAVLYIRYGYYFSTHFSASCVPLHGYLWPH